MECSDVIHLKPRNFFQPGFNTYKNSRLYTATYKLSNLINKFNLTLDYP